MKYAVLQKYYDTGKVTAQVIKVPAHTENHHITRPEWDEWLDVFDSQSAADSFRRETLRA